MTSEDNKCVVRRFFEEFIGKGNWQIFEEIIAPDAVDHTMSREDWTPTREDFKQHISWFRNAYPDMQITVDDMVAEGERVITFWTMRGTHQGEFLGYNPRAVISIIDHHPVFSQKGAVAA